MKSNFVAAVMTSALFFMACHDDSANNRVDREGEPSSDCVTGGDCDHPSDCTGGKCDHPSDCTGGKCDHPSDCTGGDCDHPSDCTGGDCDHPSDCIGGKCDQPLDCTSGDCDQPSDCTGGDCDHPSDCTSGDCDHPSDCTGGDCDQPSDCTSGDCDQPSDCTGGDCDHPSDCADGDCDHPSDCTGGDCDQPLKCVDLCEVDSKKCENDVLYQCQKNAEGCLEWRQLERCVDSHAYCDDSSLSCKSCVETCSGVGRRCGVENTIEVCRADAHGCAQWSSEKSCEEDEHCDDRALECVTGCDDCEIGLTKCDGASIKKCELLKDGCTVWKVLETCAFAQQCYDENGPKCEYACGDECDPFTLVIMPDTQNYVRSNRGIYKNQTEWLRDHKEKENIKFIMHMGDVINDNDDSKQFPRAIEAHDVLAEAGLPYSVSTGNHDYKKAADGTRQYGRSKARFSDYFNDDYIKKGFSDSSWFHGFHYLHNMYATFEVGHLKFAVIALEYRPRKEVLCWADDLIRTELKDRYVIITTHALLDYDSSSNGDAGYDNQIKSMYYEVPNGANGLEVYAELAARHSNVIMVACGHNHDAEHRVTTGYHGNMIHELLVDYQAEPYESKCPSSGRCDHQTDGGNGWLRLLRIDPVNKKKADGTLENNVESRLVRTLDEKTKACTRMYCTKNYDGQSTQADHQYSLALDFSEPIHYEYSINDHYAFTTNTINNVETGKQSSPAVAVNRTTGSYVAVWSDNNEDLNIEARVFCAGGCRETDQFMVNTSRTGDQMNPAVAMDDAGNFVVVWEGDTDGDGNYEIYMRGFDAKGKERIAETQVNRTNVGQQKQASVDMNGSGDLVVVWSDESQSQYGSQIHMRGFKADGSESFSDRVVAEPTLVNRTHPDVAVNEDGSFVVVWQEMSDELSSQIMARGFKPDGRESLAGFTVSKNTEGQHRDPKISMDASGYFYIVWSNDSSTDFGHTVKVSGFDPVGKEIMAAKTLFESTGLVNRPDVCVSDDHRALVTWASYQSESVEEEVYRLSIEPQGEIKEAAKVNYLEHGSQTEPAIGCASDGRNVVLFVDDTMGTGETNIYGRGFDD